MAFDVSRVFVQVRDFSFSPDNGAISRIIYDDFGLDFLPVNFFDCYSISAQDVLSIGRSEVVVYDEARCAMLLAEERHRHRMCCEMCRAIEPRGLLT